MGAWDVDSFDNDTACDWAERLEEEDGLSLVTATLDRILDSTPEYIDAWDAAKALAAAEVVARLQGNFGVRNAYTETVDKWVSTQTVVPSPEFAQKAHA